MAPAPAARCCSHAASPAPRPRLPHGACGPVPARPPQALSIYSEYYSSEGGNLAFDQIPWFMVAERLEAEKQQLLADRERFTAALMEHQVRRTLPAEPQRRCWVSLGASPPLTAPSVSLSACRARW